MNGFVDNDLQKIWAAIQGLNGAQNPITATIDITGLTTIDMAGVEYADFVILTSSNATESINRIINNVSNKPITFRPASGLTVTFNSKNVLSPNQNLSLYAASVAAQGTKNGFLTVQKRTPQSTTGFYQINFIDQYYS